MTALLQLKVCISVKTRQVNAKPGGVNRVTEVYKRLQMQNKKFSFGFLVSLWIICSPGFQIQASANEDIKVLTLRQTIKSAMQANLALKSSLEGKNAALAQKKVQRTNFLPSLSDSPIISSFPLNTDGHDCISGYHMLLMLIAEETTSFQEKNIVKPHLSLFSDTAFTDRAPLLYKNARPPWSVAGGLLSG